MFPLDLNNYMFPPASPRSRGTLQRRPSVINLCTFLCRPLPAGEAPSESGTFFMLQVHERVEISRVEVYEMV